MTDGPAPSWFDVLRADLRDLRTDINSRLDNLVPVQSFEAERRRVDGRFQDQGQDIVDLRVEVRQALADEVAARKLSISDEANARKAGEAALEKKSAATGLWVRWGVGLVLGVPASIATIIGLANLIAGR